MDGQQPKRKICVMGFSGSGKSTLARALGRRYGLPVLHLDTVHFLPGWVARSMEQQREMVRAFMEEHPDGWVIDGNYAKVCYEERIREADEIILLHFNRFSCLWRAWRRSRKYRDRSRFSMTAGCPEVMDWAFVSWILWRGRGKKQKQITGALLKNHGYKTVCIRNQRTLDRFWASRELESALRLDENS